MTVRDGRVLLEDRALDLGASSAPDGPAMLHFRPHDATIGKPGEDAIEGMVTAVRRHGAMRRLELAIGGGGPRVEIDAQPDFYVRPGRQSSPSCRPSGSFTRRPDRIARSAYDRPRRRRFHNAPIGILR